MPFCHQETPWLTQVKGFGTYTVPTLDVQLSGTFQAVPGEVEQSPGPGEFDCQQSETDQHDEPAGTGQRHQNQAAHNDDRADETDHNPQREPA